MCKVYKIDFHSLNTVCYYTGQSDIADDLFKVRKLSCTNVALSTTVLLSYQLKERRC